MPPRKSKTKEVGPPKSLSFFERPEVASALIGEALEDAIAKIDPEFAAPIIATLRFADDYLKANAAQQVELLPALPAVAAGPTSGIGLQLADYRSLVQQAIQLAEGGEGLFANFVEQMIESVSAGFENRLATTDLAEIGDNPQNIQDGSQPDNSGNPSEPKAPKGKSPGKGKNSQQQNFIGVFDTFCRMVNADANGVSILGRRRGMPPLLAEFMYQYWVTGMAVALVRWGSVKVPELNYRAMQMPVEVQFLDPLTIDLTDFPTRGIVWYQPPPKVKTQLVNEVRQTYGGDPSKHPFFAIWPTKDSGNKYTQLVPLNPNTPMNIFSAKEAFQILQSNSKLPLPPGNFTFYRRMYNTTSTLYPTPFASRIFAPINDKRMLRGMDRSLIRKVIMMILQVAVASPDPKRPVREGDLLKTQKRIEEQLQADPEYLQIITTPADTRIDWIIPEGGSIFNRDRYMTVDFEILASLAGLVANQLMSTSGNVDMTLIGKTLYQKNQKCLMDFKGWLQELYDQIIAKNNLRAIKPDDVTIVFKQFDIYESDAFKTFIYNLVVKGFLPARAAIDHMGEDYDSMIEELVHEEQLRRQYNILLTPPTNMQGTYPGYGVDPANPDAPAPGQPTDTSKPGTTKEGKPSTTKEGKPPAKAPVKPSGPGGRPPGSTDSQPRQTKNSG